MIRMTPPKLCAPVCRSSPSSLSYCCPSCPALLPVRLFILSGNGVHLTSVKQLHCAECVYEDPATRHDAPHCIPGEMILYRYRTMERSSKHAVAHHSQHLAHGSRLPDSVPHRTAERSKRGDEFPPGAVRYTGSDLNVPPKSIASVAREPALNIPSVGRR